MDIRRIESVVSDMEDLLNDIQTECNDFNFQRGEWYDGKLIELRSGLITAHDFNKTVWEYMMNLHDPVGDNVYSILSCMRSLIRNYKVFKREFEQLKTIVKDNPVHKPFDWKEFDVSYIEDGIDYHQTCKVFAQNEELALKRLQSNEPSIKVMKIEEVV